MKFYQDLEVTGAIYVSESITVPVLYSTASNAVSALTASYVNTARTASYMSGSIVNYPDPYTGTAVITNVMTLTEDEYLAIGTKNTNTLYLVI
jgi:hypothetical protein